MGRKRKTAAPAEAKIGHNSNLNADEKVKLSGFVSEIERVDAEVRELTSERGAIYKSAKEHGFDTKALKHMIRMRCMEKSKRQEFEAAVEAYTHAMGDFISTPLGQAGLEAAQAAHA